MYDNVSQKLKSFTKVLTVILLVLIPAGGITGGIFLLLAEAPIGYVIASVLGSAVLALLVYYGSCFAYGLAELLEQQTIATSLLRQVAHSNQSPVQQTRQEPAAPTYPLRQTGPGPRQPMQPPAAPQPEPCAGAYPYAKPQYSGYTLQPGPYVPYTPQYRTQTPYGTATGFNEEFRYEPKR